MRCYLCPRSAIDVLRVLSTGQSWPLCRPCAEWVRAEYVRTHGWLRVVDALRPAGDA